MQLKKRTDLSNDEMKFIISSLEDNANDMMAWDLWEIVEDDWHTDNYEADDKEALERKYVEIMSKEIFEDPEGWSREYLIQEGWIFEEESLE